MRAKEITERAIKAIKSKLYDFILINLSNPDMIGHTGDFKATQTAIKFVDKCAQKIAKASLSVGGETIITADHGNAELMEKDGKPVTSHTTSPVRLILVSEKNRSLKLRDGRLACVSPTILDLFGLKQPKEMTESSLIIKDN